MARRDDGSPADARYGRARQLVAASVGEGPHDVPSVLLSVCRELNRDLESAGVAVSLMNNGESVGVVAASSDWARDVDDLQFTTGEGPCHRAFHARRPVLTPDLQHVPGNPWPGYTSSALLAGVRAVFAFPLHIGVTSFGVLNVYADKPGSLEPDREASALTFAQIATETLLDAALATPDGELEAGLASALDYRGEIHQAQGMVMFDLDVSPVAALARMRAHAFATDQPLIDLARAIIGGSVLPDDN